MEFGQVFEHMQDPKSFCWTGITPDGALCGGYGDTLEECENEAKALKCTWFSAGETPADLLI